MKILKFNEMLNEGVILPKRIKLTDSQIESFESFKKACMENGFDVVEYDEFFDSLPEKDKNGAPPRMSPLFALFHPTNKRPMIVLNKHIYNANLLRALDIEGIMEHELIHSEQSNRSNIEYSLPSVKDASDYFVDKNEIMAFSYNIAKELSKDESGIKAFLSGNKRAISSYSRTYSSINNFIKDESIIKRYNKYIYQYLDELGILAKYK